MKKIVPDNYDRKSHPKAQNHQVIRNACFDVGTLRDFTSYFGVILRLSMSLSFWIMFAGSHQHDLIGRYQFSQYCFHGTRPSWRLGTRTSLKLLLGSWSSPGIPDSSPTTPFFHATGWSRVWRPLSDHKLRNPFWRLWYHFRKYLKKWSRFIFYILGITSKEGDSW